MDKPARLPEPFVAVSDDDCAWSIDPRTLPDFEARTAAPYPALVTLGQDSADGHILVDLEQIGALNLSGDPELTEGALTGLAIELACSKWADELRVSVVGFASDLPSAFNTGRVRYIKNISELVIALEARAHQDAELLEELQLGTSHDARISALSHDSWPPEIILLSQLPDEETSARLAALVENVPRVGIAAITQGHLAGEWALNINDDRTATLLPAGISLKAQVVAGDNYTNILGALRSTIGQALPARPGDVPRGVVHATPAPVEETNEISSTNALQSALPSDDVDRTTVDQVSTSEERDPEDAAGVGGTSPQPTDTPTAEPSTKGESVDSDLEIITVPDNPGQLVDAEARKGCTRAREELRIELPDAPFVRVLGNVRIENAKGIEPGSVAGGSTPRAKEVIVYLALHPEQSTEEYDQAIHPNKVMSASKRNPLISRARKWLDTDPEGNDYLARYDVAKCYTLHSDVLTDWHVFQELVGDDVAAASSGRLEAALELVTGQPFSGVRSSRGSWAWSEADQQHMVAAIADVAYEVAERAKEDANAPLLLKAAIQGGRVNPASEIHKRHKLEAFAMHQDREGFEATVTQILDQCEALEEEGPEQETLDLIDRLRHRFERVSST